MLTCSGAADGGEISDHASWKLTREGAVKMFCLSGVGGHVKIVGEYPSVAELKEIVRK
ncbi:putative zinc-binding protein [Candidatus Latescibacterota bacterium]